MKSYSLDAKELSVPMSSDWLLCPVSGKVPGWPGVGTCCLAACRDFCRVWPDLPYEVSTYIWLRSIP